MNLGKITTPTGESVFVKVHEPDTTYGKPGSFTATIKISAEAAEEFKVMLAPHIKNALRQLKSEGAEVTKETLNLPLKTQEDGTVLVTAKVKAGGKNRKTGEDFFNRVEVLDIEGEQAKSDLIGRGSKVKLTADVVPYNFDKDGKTFAGISFRLKAIQVLKLEAVETKAAKKAEMPF